MFQRRRECPELVLRFFWHYHYYLTSNTLVLHQLHDPHNDLTVIQTSSSLISRTVRFHILSERAVGILRHGHDNEIWVRLFYIFFSFRLFLRNRRVAMMSQSGRSAITASVHHQESPCCGNCVSKHTRLDALTMSRNVSVCGHNHTVSLSLHVRWLADFVHGRPSVSARSLLHVSRHG